MSRWSSTASYSREDYCRRCAFVSLRRTPSTMPEGVASCDDVQSDAFLITLKKSDRDFSPTTMYRDFAISSELFHWESQSTTSSASPTGQRYINHRQNGSHILLFVRAAKTNALGTSPYVFLGPASYVSHEGDKPMAITWRLRRPMPTEVYQGVDGRSCMSEDAAADIVLVTCVKSKGTRPCAAKDLYTSTLFKKQRAHAEKTGVPWFILSAEHGLVGPDEWIAPYERYLADTTMSYRAAWGAWVAARLELLAGHCNARLLRSTPDQRMSMRFGQNWRGWAHG